MNKVKSDLIRKLLHTRATHRVVRALERLKSADVADLFGVLSPGETVALVDVLFFSNRAAQALTELPDDFLPVVLEQLDDERVAGLISRLSPNEGAHFIQSVSEERRANILSQLPYPRRARVEQILTYPEDSAGRLMNTDFLAFSANATADDVITQIRSTSEASDSLFHIYVMDDNNYLVGGVPLRRLIAVQPDRTLGDIMVRDPVSVSALADQEEAAHLVARHNLLGLPAVNDQHQMVGVITVDDVIEVIQEEATEDMYRLAGLEEGDRVFSPTVESVRRRLPWNLLNMLTAFLAAAVVGMFESTIANLVVLATFMPVVAGIGGNAGIQTLTVVTRGIALGEIQFSSGLRAVFKEVAVGLCIGLLLGTLTAIIAFLWKGNPMLGGVLVLAMICNMTLAGLMGAAIPLCLKWLDQDPALGGGIILTAFTDSVGFLTFLGLAHLLMDYLI